jgi:hypothetical protein
MKPQLNDIIERLGNDQFFAVRITDLDKGLPVCSNKMGAEMVAEKGNIENFFNSIYQKGVRNVVIQPRRKNGSSWKDDGSSLQYSFEPQQEKVHHDEPIAPTQQANHAQEFTFPGLMGGNIGLNAAQANYRVMDYERITRENAELKDKNKRLSKKVKRLEHEALQNEYSENKAKGNKDLINNLSSQLPGIMGAFAAMKGGGSAQSFDPGLSSPFANLSENKQQLIDAITQAPENAATYLYEILMGMMHNQEFGDEIFELLKKHKPTQTA